MSASAKKITPLELFVKAFLREHKRIKIGRIHIQDAILLINKKLGLICCDNPPTPVSLHNRPELHNQFVDTIKQLLKNTIKRGNVKSLERTKALILNACCCSTVTFNFTNDMNPADSIIQVYDAITNELIYQTTTTDGITQIACIPNIYFNTNKIKLCLNVINLPFCEGRVTCEYDLTDMSGSTIYVTILCDSSIGLNCQDNNVVPFDFSKTSYNLSLSCQGG